MKTRVVVVGGGIVGLATAFRLLQARPDSKVVVLDKEDRVAAHQTGNNSGVIHSGVYYKPGSLKAKLCVEGSRDMVAFCRQHDIPHRICGKIILATHEKERDGLREIARRGELNGIKGLRLLSGKDLSALEPNARGLEALHVPSTGIVDFTSASKKMAEQIGLMGGEVVLRQRVTRIVPDARGPVRVVTEDNEFEAEQVVTCAGLHSDRVARMTDPEAPVRILPFRGEYYMVKPERVDLVRGLIYPVPDSRFPFLGVHFTRTVAGGLEVGPNAILAMKREGYRKFDVNVRDLWESLTWPGFHQVAKKYWRTAIAEYYRSFSKWAFTQALQRLVPDIREDDLIRGGAGVRAQASERTGALVDDFLFIEHGRVLHVCNAPSPAATASLAIGSVIAQRVTETSASH